MHSNRFLAESAPSEKLSGAETWNRDVWCDYIAGMIETYLGFNKPQAERQTAIAGIIRRRLPFVESHAETVLQAPAGLHSLVAKWDEECRGLSTEWHGGLQTAANELRAALASHAETVPHVPAGQIDREAIIQLAHRLDDAAQHITERQAYDFATCFRQLAGCKGDEASDAILASMQAEAPQATKDAEPTWIVNDLGELGVKVGERFFFLYKGDNIEYGVDGIGEAKDGIALHGDDGSQMMYRIVGKREFGEVQYPAKWLERGFSGDRYNEPFVFTPGLSYGEPSDGDWKPLPAISPKTEAAPTAAQPGDAAQKAKRYDWLLAERYQDGAPAKEDAEPAFMVSYGWLTDEEIGQAIDAAMPASPSTATKEGGSNADPS